MCYYGYLWHKQAETQVYHSISKLMYCYQIICCIVPVYKKALFVWTTSAANDIGAITPDKWVDDINLEMASCQFNAVITSSDVTFVLLQMPYRLLSADLWTEIAAIFSLLCISNYISMALIYFIELLKQSCSKAMREIESYYQRF